jgi:predicted RNase H-like nuclease (RuvC/YqgF family)
MAQRKLQTKQVAPRAKVRVASAGRARPETVEGLRAECERLASELAAAREEIEDLNTRRDSAINRIDWVLDSLNSLPEADG